MQQTFCFLWIHSNSFHQQSLLETLLFDWYRQRNSCSKKQKADGNKDFPEYSPFFQKVQKRLLKVISCIFLLWHKTLASSAFEVQLVACVQFFFFFSPTGVCCKSASSEPHKWRTLVYLMVKPAYWRSDVLAASLVLWRADIISHHSKMSSVRLNKALMSQDLINP